MTRLKLALDWTPNVNHIGFLIAKQLGFYSELGIDLELLNPAIDNYVMTPGKKLELDMADFAIAPFETVISLNNKANRVDAVAIYAILQQDLSCIATLESANITRPKLLENHIYASYKARYEDTIIKEMIKNDGGTGSMNIIYPEKLGIWNTLLSGEATATWIFDNWEGIEARGKGIALTKFALNQFNIPYGYSPVILAKKEKILKNKDLYTNFIKATKKGFLFTKNNLEQSTGILKSFVTAYDRENISLADTISFSQPHYGDEHTCGKMEEKRVSDFLKWLVHNRLENENILSQNLFTNELCD